MADDKAWGYKLDGTDTVVLGRGCKEDKPLDMGEVVVSWEGVVEVEVSWNNNSSSNKLKNRLTIYYKLNIMAKS